MLKNIISETVDDDDDDDDGNDDDDGLEITVRLPFLKFKI